MKTTGHFSETRASYLIGVGGDHLQDIHHGKQVAEIKG